MAGNTGTTINNEIEALEKEIHEKQKKLAGLKRFRPREEVKDYTLQGPGGTKISLSEMFGDHDELLLIHNMGKKCRYCTLWADGFNGFLRHFENRAGFVVVSPDDPETQKEFASGRNWKFKMYSGKGSTFIKDMGFEDDEGRYQPGFSTFIKDNGKIYRTASDWFGPFDDYCSVWHLFNLLPRGVNDWKPEFEYQ